MAFLLGLASLLVVPLSSARCADPLPAEENESPVINLKLDPWKKLLTWSYQTNVTEQECQIDTPPSSSTRQIPEPGDQDEYSCHFPNAVLHRGANLTVHGTADGAAFRCALHFHNAGREGSGAVNFSCVIYNVQLLNCSWAPGPAAPADVQYQLHCWACRGEEEIECPHYMLDGAGTRVGCHFGALPEPQLTDKYIFLLNGTSPEAGVRFVDFPPFRAIQMEKLNPPANLTVDYNGSHHIVQWDNPEMRFDLPRSSLCYEVDVQVAGTSSQEDPVSQYGQEKNVYLVPYAAVRGGRSVRLRGRTLPSAVWSEWSTTLPFAGHPEPEVSGTAVALVGLLVGAVVLLVSILTFLCTRWPLRRTLFPPVPQVKPELVGSLAPSPKILWAGDHQLPSSPDPEDIVAVEEMLPCVSGPAAPATLGPSPAPPKL
ncbi:colony stimulating factor 2 receptor subunit alpha [Phyllostomus discolor]|uniref:Colony stimulating factor 2 receptor subunit alpha n=1 Tax=Phyllostomus discolor TaxID=89673 RepID=A0A833ZD17_9CHIR|nr:colony stimulating factor 2 receptor subunit alpha [Phyllostomus discolor]